MTSHELSHELIYQNFRYQNSHELIYQNLFTNVNVSIYSRQLNGIGKAPINSCFPVANYFLPI
jgi:predicted SprT family Zn-dependent metalloprotease